MTADDRSRPTEAPLLILELGPDGIVTATGQHSTVESRGAEFARTRLALDRLRASGAASWHWDGMQLLARTSDTGLVPLYYHADANTFAISTSLLALRGRLAHSSLDWPAISILLAFGGFIEDDTPFLGIKALPLRTTLSWSRGSLTVEERTFEIPRLTLDYEEAKYQYRSTFREAVERSLPADDFALGLSGGRDSRHILLQLLELGARPGHLVTSNHYLSASDSDTTAAAMLAQRVGLPVSHIAPDPDRIAAELAKNELIEFESLAHSWGLRLGMAFSEAPVLFDGMNGGVLFGRSPFVLALSDESGKPLHGVSHIATAAVERWFDKAIERVDSLFIENPLSTSALDEARHRIERSLWKYEDAPNPAQAFHYFNHTGRATVPFTYGLMRANGVRCPFDDPEMVRFGLGLQSPVSHNPRLQSEAIREAFPQYADLPFAEELTGAPTSLHSDRDAERVTASDLLEQMAHVDLPALEPHAAERYASGQAPLPELQAITYLGQLLAFERAAGR